MVLGRTLAGAISLGSFTFLTGAFSRSRRYIEKILSGFNDISEQAVFLQDGLKGGHGGLRAAR